MKFVLLALFVAFGASATKPNKQNLPPSTNEAMLEEESNSMEEESDSNHMEEEASDSEQISRDPYKMEDEDLEDFYDNPHAYEKVREVFLYEASVDLKTLCEQLPRMRELILLDTQNYDSSRNKKDPNNPNSRRNRPCTGFSRIPNKVFAKLRHFAFVGNDIDVESMSKFQKIWNFLALRKLELKNLTYSENISPWKELWEKVGVDKFKNLRVLELKGDWITSLESLVNTNFRNLETLAIEDNLVNLKPMRRAHFPNLTELRLSLTYNPSALSQCSMPKLARLHLDRTLEPLWNEEPQNSNRNRGQASHTAIFARCVLPKILFPHAQSQNSRDLQFSLDNNLLNEEVEKYINKSMKNLVKFVYEHHL